MVQCCLKWNVNAFEFLIIHQTEKKYYSSRNLLKYWITSEEVLLKFIAEFLLKYSRTLFSFIFHLTFTIKYVYLKTILVPFIMQMMVNWKNGNIVIVRCWLCSGLKILCALLLLGHTLSVCVSNDHKSVKLFNENDTNKHTLWVRLCWWNPESIFVICTRKHIKCLIVK